MLFSASSIIWSLRNLPPAHQHTAFVDADAEVLIGNYTHTNASTFPSGRDADHDVERQKNERRG